MNERERQRWEAYFFQRHSPDELRSWAKRLKMFRFFRAFGGHANDSDSLDLAFCYRSEEELVKFFADLGSPLIKHNVEPKQPQPGVAYKTEEYDQFVSLIPGTRWIEQPRWVTLGVHRVFAWCSPGHIQFTASTGYEVTEEDVARAEALEAAMGQVSLERIDPPLDTPHYICPRYYPDFFRD